MAFKYFKINYFSLLQFFVVFIYVLKFQILKSFFLNVVYTFLRRFPPSLLPLSLFLLLPPLPLLLFCLPLLFLLFSPLPPPPLFFSFNVFSFFLSFFSLLFLLLFIFSFLLSLFPSSFFLLSTTTSAYHLYFCSAYFIAFTFT